MPTTPTDLVETFVVEVGEREAWPFLTFCDNTPTPPVETRLYIDTDYELAGQADLPALMGLTVTSTEVGPEARLEISFEHNTELVVSGTANAATTDDVWWLGRA